MEISGAGKSPNTSLSFRYNANNEELEELFDACDDDPPTPQFDTSTNVQSETASPKRSDKSPSILDKYFKSMRADKSSDKTEKQEEKVVEPKSSDDNRTPPKEVSSSPMKDYLSRLSKKSTSESADVKEVGSNETWKIFHDFKFKIAQAVEDMKTRSLEETKEKSVPRDNSMSDSEENSAIKDSDHSVGDTDNQVSSLNSSIQNLSELTQPLTAKATDREFGVFVDNKNNSDSSDDTQKNLVHSETAELTKEILDTNVMEVESGVEALEDGIDGLNDLPQLNTTCPNLKSNNNEATPPLLPNTSNFGLPPSKTNLQELTNKKSYTFFSFTLYFLTFILFVNYFLFPDCNVWNGFLLGIWVFYLVSSLKQYFMETYFGDMEPYKNSFFQLKRSSTIPMTYTIPSVKEHRPIKKFEGWINHYRYPEYDPFTYSVNKTSTAFMKLEGCNLRISYTRTKIAKRALWDEKIEKVEFYQHRLYNLTGARLMLLPKELVSRRQWSKKYPICIVLNENEKIQVLEKETLASERKSMEATDKKKDQQAPLETESAETNTSPEKKKKFIWRRRDKSSPHTAHTDSDIGKEGLRHRLVRKMHRDKKVDNLSSYTDVPEATSVADKNTQQEEQQFHDAEGDLATKSNISNKEDVDDDIDDNELTKIKEFLEETELETGTEGANDGEWSLHVKDSRDSHANLFLFGRTGRDKLEWYRRLMTAISEANAASAESSAADDKSSSEPAPENKDGIEMAVYKVSEKETVAFAKGSQKTESVDTSNINNVTVTAPTKGLDDTFESYEKTFWPFLLKIIQSHEMANVTKSEVAVMCQLEPSPKKTQKAKKKSKDSKGNTENTCECRVLPAEVTWINTILARVVYDLTKNNIILARMQNRIQKKLNTMKLPSFMSPLMVTSLCVGGSCPLIQRVLAPSWDERGVWLHADLRYDGGAHIAILTQINLMKLKEKNVTLEEQLLSTAETVPEFNIHPISPIGDKTHLKKHKPAIYDSEAEDSAESSDDEDSQSTQDPDTADSQPAPDILLLHTEPRPSTTESMGGTASSKKKFLRMVDRIATNKYFQQVTDYKYVKRAMEGLSNTDIKLQVEIHGLEGRLAINLPPPPHDRAWIGFLTNPQLVLKARPAVGARTLRFAHISKWIEEKLSKEFEKILVLPNMEDISIDIMTPTPLEFQ